MQLANPLQYPLAVFVAGITLVLGVRMARIPGQIMLPVAGVVALGGAMLRKSQQPVALHLGNSELEQQIYLVQSQAQDLANKAESLRQEAGKLLGDSDQMELLVAVQYACDRATELPSKITQLAQQIQGGDSLLSTPELTHQLQQVQKKLPTSQGVAKEQLRKLETSLKNNLHLIQQGVDARQAQVTSLQTLVLESAGMLQTLQNQLRTSNLGDLNTRGEIQELSQELIDFQNNFDLLLSKES